MSESFDLDEVEHLTAGTVGPPGQRVFYLQARHRGQVVSLKLEKQQLAALAELVARLLADLPEPATAPDLDMTLVDPVSPAWTIGVLGVSYDEVADRFVILAEELADEDEAGEDAGAARVRITREQAAALAAHGAELVEAGRPPCPLCGYPLDPSGHECPRSNGRRPPAL